MNSHEDLFNSLTPEQRETAAEIAAEHERQLLGEPEAGSLWCHYKGGHYEVICVATHTETGERMVVYKSIDGGDQVWTRPLSMWHEDVGVPGVLARFQKEP